MTATVEVTAPPETDEPSVIVCAIPADDQPLHSFMQDEDPHVTLAYLGPASQLAWFMSTATDDVQEAARSTGPFKAKVSGYGRLGDNGAAVLFLESEELSQLHDEVTAQPCLGQLIELNETYPEWIPHITLGYGEDYPEEKLQAAGEAVPWVTIDRVGLWAGESQQDFLLDQGLTQLYEDVDQGILVDMSDMSDGPVWTWDGKTASGFQQVGHAFGFGMAAAAKPGSYDPTLHPRGADGRFIPTTGVIKWLKNGKWKYGKVAGINKGDHGATEITVAPSDLGGNSTGEPPTVLKPSQVYTAPVKKAHLTVNTPGAKQIGAQKGSNTGGLYEIPTAEPGPSATTQTDQFYIKQAGSKEKGRNEELANTLYEMAGVYVPAVDYNPADNNIYSKIIPGVHDMAARLDDPVWMDKVRRNFAVDAWLSNRDVFGMTLDNILTDEHGEPVRIDNGGALLYRAMGAKKTDFDGKVGELDVFRTGSKAKVYGHGMTKEQELDGAQRVLAISPGEIDDAVSKAGLPKSLADTMKARRKYLADYYGLPLPESVKPMDSDQIATTAPVFDPGDIAVSGGKDRNWIPSNLAQSQFILSPGDRVQFPDGTEEDFGLDPIDGTPLSVVAQHNQLHGWTQKYGHSVPVMVKRSLPPDAVRPEHNSVVPVHDLTGLNWQRGDSITDSDGNVYDVRGASAYTGGLLVQQHTGDGSPTTPFLIDTHASNPTHKSYIVHRWDPPAKKEQVPDQSVTVNAPEPTPVVLPKSPEGMAEEAKTAIKADLEQPLPDSDAPGAPAPKKTKPGSDLGLGMILGDGTEAQPGDQVSSAKDGKVYVYKKKKGPYAIVTDPTATDPTDEKTALASTLSQPDKIPTAVVEKPKTKDGKTPAVGMYAEAKDGWAGEITMISPDGKFVFITNADGKKKRKSTGTVTITATPGGLPAVDMAQKAPDIDHPVAPGTGVEGDFKKVSSQNLKAGDQISFDGEHWMKVVSVTWNGSVGVDDQDATAANWNHLSVTDADLPVLKKGPEPDVTQTSSVSTTGVAVDLNKEFMNIGIWDTWEQSPGTKLTTVGWPTDGNKPALVAMINGDPNMLTLVYKDSLPHTPVELTFTGVPSPDGQPQGSKVTDLYEVSYTHVPVNGNAAYNYQAITQGIKTNTPGQYLTYDPTTETFWNNVPGVPATSWNKTTKQWELPDSPTVAESFQPVDTPAVPSGKGIFGLEKVTEDIPDGSPIASLLDSGQIDTVLHYKGKPEDNGWWYGVNSKDLDQPIWQTGKPLVDADVHALKYTGNDVMKKLGKQTAGSSLTDATPRKPATPPDAPTEPGLTMTPPEAPEAPGPAAAPKFNGYTAKPGDKIKKFTTDNGNELYFLQTPDDVKYYNSNWHEIASDGVTVSWATQDNMLSSLTNEDGITVENVYGPDAVSTDGETPTPSAPSLPAPPSDSFQGWDTPPEPGTKLLKVTEPNGDVSWYVPSSTAEGAWNQTEPVYGVNGQNYYEGDFDEDWTQEQFQMPAAGDGGGQAPEPVTVNGYQLKPGESALHGTNPAYTMTFIKPAGDDQWYGLNPDTQQPATPISQESIDALKAQGWTQSDAPGGDGTAAPEAEAPAAPAAPAPQVFGGYTAKPGDMVFEQPSVSTTDPTPKYIVKQADGNGQWHLVDPATGELSNDTTFDDEIIAWAASLNGPTSSKQVYGDQFNPSSPNTPITDIHGMATTGKPNAADLKFHGTQNGLNNAQILTWENMPPLNPGDTPFAYPSTYQSSIFVLSNTGQVWEYNAYNDKPLLKDALPTGDVQQLDIVPNGQPKSALSTVPDLPGGYHLQPGEKAIHVDYGTAGNEWLVTSNGIDAYILNEETGKSGIPGDLANYKKINANESPTYTEYTAEGSPAPLAAVGDDFTPEGVPVKYQAGKGQAIMTFTYEGQKMAYAKTGPDEWHLISPANGQLAPYDNTKGYIKANYELIDPDITIAYPNGFSLDGYPSASPPSPAAGPVPKSSLPGWLAAKPLADKLYGGEHVLQDGDGDLWVQIPNGAYVLSGTWTDHLSNGGPWGENEGSSYEGVNSFGDPWNEGGSGIQHEWTVGGTTQTATPEPTPKPYWVDDVQHLLDDNVSKSFPGQKLLQDDTGTVWIETQAGGNYVTSNTYDYYDAFDLVNMSGLGTSFDGIAQTYGISDQWAPDAPAAAPGEITKPNWFPTNADLDPNALYLVDNNNGTWKSTDGGKNYRWWHPASNSGEYVWGSPYPKQVVEADYGIVAEWNPQTQPLPAATPGAVSTSSVKPDWMQPVDDLGEEFTFPGQKYVKDKDGDVWVQAAPGSSTYYTTKTLSYGTPSDMVDGYGTELDVITDLYSPTETWEKTLGTPTPELATTEFSGPVYPGSVPPTELEKASWGGALTKDGYVPTAGMYVTGKASPGGPPLNGKIVQFSKDKTKATVLSVDGKKTQRLVKALMVDKGKNYQVYAAPPPVDLGPIPADMPIPALPPKEAMAETAKDGKWRAILHGNSSAVSGGKMMVTRAKTPSGKSVLRVHFVLSDKQRTKLLTHLTTEDAPANPANIQKGDWEQVSQQSQDVAVGMKLGMRYASTNKWVVDNKTNPSEPTHEVISVSAPTPDGKRVVQLKNLSTGDTITSSFHPDKPITNFVWDPNKPVVPKPPVSSGYSSYNTTKLSNSAKLNGWSNNSTSDHGIPEVDGGSTNGTLAVEPGKPVPESVAAFRESGGSAFDNGGIRQIRSDGVVVDVIHPGSGSSSVYGYTVITVPDEPDAEQKLQSAFAELQMPYEPLTQEGAKKAARGMLKNLLQFDSSANYKHVDDNPSGDAAMFHQVNQALGMNDVGWQDLLVGTMDSNGKVEYIWSERVRNAMTKKMKLTTLVRGANTGTAGAIASNLEGGGANTTYKMAAGLISGNKGRGISASADANNGTTGSFTAANGKQDGPNFPGMNTHYQMKSGTGSGFLVFSNPLEAMGRLGDTRHSLYDNFGLGGNNGADHFTSYFTTPYIGDMAVGGGIPSEGVAFIGVKDETVRKSAIAELHKRGIFEVNGRPVEEIILTRQKLTTMNIADHMPPMYVPPNARPITELPDNYPAAGATEALGAAA